MPTKEYRIYVKGILSFVKFSQKDFDKVCSHLESLEIKYTTNIIDLF